MEIFT